MNRSELIEAVADRLEVRRQEAADAVEAVIETIKAEVAKGEKVAISGFGIFEQFQRSARTMKSPFDGRTIKVKAKPVPKFKAGAEFKAFVENPRAALKKAQASAKKAQASAKKAPAKTAAAAKKTTTAAKTAAKAAPAKTAAAAKKTTTAAKTAAKKAPVKKAPAKKAPAKTAAKKAPAKKTAAKK